MIWGVTMAAWSVLQRQALVVGDGAEVVTAVAEGAVVSNASSYNSQDAVENR